MSTAYFRRASGKVFQVAFAVLLWSVASNNDAVAGGTERLISIDPGSETITATNKLTGQPVTLKIDPLRSEILIEKKKAAFSDLNVGQKIAYSMSTDGMVAARIVVESPAESSVFRHKTVRQKEADKKKKAGK